MTDIATKTIVNIGGLFFACLMAWSISFFVTMSIMFGAAGFGYVTNLPVITPDSAIAISAIVGAVSVIGNSSFIIFCWFKK